MSDNNDIDQHFAGTFNLCGEEITGEIIYNKESGALLLNLFVLLSEDHPIGKTYDNLSVITGALNSGAIVTLFQNRCIKNQTHFLQHQQLIFQTEYLVLSKRDESNKKYNKYVCILENALDWSGLSIVDTRDISAIRFKKRDNDNIYHWFGAKISFSTSFNCELFNYPHKEESKVIERLIVNIETDEKKDISFFVDVRNKIASLISFAIRDNINYDEQYLFDFDDSYQISDNSEYYKHHLYTSERRRLTHVKNFRGYNFSLCQIPPEKDIQETLTLLEPVFNLYLSLFRYTDMPLEMIFLNIVQALETFHSRFFYDDSKEKYVESVESRFSNLKNYTEIKKLLLCDTQMDKNCNYIILVSRLNDLLIGKYDGLFCDYFITNPEFAQTIADTRHYYTHYAKSKEKKALKGDKLANAIGILSLLLEYNVCLQLGIDNHSKTEETLGRLSE